MVPILLNLDSSWNGGTWEVIAIAPASLPEVTSSQKSAWGKCGPYYISLARQVISSNPFLDRAAGSWCERAVLASYRQTLGDKWRPIRCIS